jgi:protein SCO1/2
MRILKPGLSAVCILASALLTTPAQSQQPPTKNAQTSSAAAQKYFTDIELINQDGQTVRFYTDLLKNKVVVINSFYATEHAGCTAMFLNLAKLRTALGDRTGRDVVFISLTVDPLTDTPAKLKIFAEGFQTGPGWSFITGKKENVEFALRKLGMFVANRDKHSMVLLIANERTGLWKKSMAMAEPADLARVVVETLNNR